METDPETFFTLIEALGIGLLIGIERERSVHLQSEGASAGVRTFALASLIGAISMMTGGVPLVMVSVIVVAAARIVSVTQQSDSSVGFTTSLALVSVVLLGAMATETAFFAAAIAVVIASLLAARNMLHAFSRSVLTTVELRDGLILGVAVLVILPLLPDTDVGPGGALNPRTLFIIVVVIMMISAAGHVATRVIGARLGLPVSGFLSGFVSSTSTILALGNHANQKPDDANSAAAGATLSSVSSLIQIGIILLALSPAMFTMGFPILFSAGLVAALHGAAIFFLAMRRDVAPSALELPSQVFSVKGSVGFALIVAVVMVVSATLNDFFGNTAVLASVALAGLVSTNSATVALASLVAAGQISAADGALPLAAALSANAIVRILIAFRQNNKPFRRTVAFGLFLQLGAIWLSLWLADLLRDWFAEWSALVS
ncbi:MgtC/SapB family protein [Yoonia sp. MH D7]